MQMDIYKAYSDYLKEKYGRKVYKLPVNLPLDCPNKKDGYGCIFCSGSGTGFEAMDTTFSVTEQLNTTKELIHKKYKAEKYIAYFQNYTNTYLELSRFKAYIKEAANVPDIVEISISTRPDCIATQYLDALKDISRQYNVNITIELGLQSANYHTLKKINRGHSLAEFIDAVGCIKPYGFEICTHVILNLPWDDDEDVIETAKILSALKTDTVKIHSLYLANDTPLLTLYNEGRVDICTKEEYINKLCLFLEYLNPAVAVERLFSRIPKEDSAFSNWGESWWKLKDEFLKEMRARNSYQGKRYDYLSGSRVKNLKNL